MAENQKPVVICMGSQSDWEVLKEAARILDEFDVSYETKVLSAHRTPELMIESAKKFQANGTRVVIAGAGGAAHLPGMLASVTTLPVVGVPIDSRNSIQGIDSLLSIVQMPEGVPVGTMAVNGAANAALFAVEILAINELDLSKKLLDYKKKLEEKVFDQQKKLDKQ